MISGAGNLLAETLDLNAGNYQEDIVYPGKIYTFDLQTDSEEKVAEAWVDGRLEDVESAIGKVTRSLTITQKALDWWSLGFMLDEIPGSSTNIPWDLVKRGNVPTVSPYEIADADITTANQDRIKVYMTGDVNGRNAQPLKIGTSTPLAKTFYPDGPNGKLVFNEAQAGATILYPVPKIWASGETIGYEADFDSWGSLRFKGELYLPNIPERIGFVFWRLTRSGIGGIAATNDVPEVQATFKATAVQAPSGRTTALSLFKLGTLQA